jgi:hypothetical protein
MAHMRTELLTYDKKTKTFIGEASDFPNVSSFHRIYPDACDVGVTLISHKTGKEADFVLNEQLTGNGKWEFEVSHISAKKHPSLHGAKLIIIND